MGDLIVQTIVVVGIGILGFVLKHIQQWNKYKHIPGVRQILPESPFAFPIPYLGPYLFRGNYKTMVELSHQFRDHEVFQVTAGWSTYVFSNSPKVAKRVMTSNNYHKPTILYSGLTMFGHNIVTAAGGHAHRRHHKVVNPAFFPSNLKYLARVSNRSTDLLMERIIAKGGTMEVNKDMTDVTVDIIGKSNFGVDLGVFESADTEDDTLSILDKSDQTLSFYKALATTSTRAVVLWSVFPPSLIRLHRPIWNAKTAVQNYP